MIVKKAGQLVTERSLDGNARTSTVTGLTNKLPYSFTVSAVNGAGQAGKVDRGEAPRCPAGRIRADLAEQAARGDRRRVVGVGPGNVCARAVHGPPVLRLRERVGGATGGRTVGGRPAHQQRAVTFIDLDPRVTYFVRVIASDLTVTQAYWPVGDEHQRIADRLNGYIWSIRPS